MFASPIQKSLESYYSTPTLLAMEKVSSYEKWVHDLYSNCMEELSRPDNVHNPKTYLIPHRLRSTLLVIQKTRCLIMYQRVMRRTFAFNWKSKASNLFHQMRLCTNKTLWFSKQPYLPFSFASFPYAQLNIYFLFSTTSIITFCCLFHYTKYSCKLSPTTTLPFLSNLTFI